VGKGGVDGASLGDSPAESSLVGSEALVIMTGRLRPISDSAVPRSRRQGPNWAWTAAGGAGQHGTSGLLLVSPSHRRSEGRWLPVRHRARLVDAGDSAPGRRARGLRAVADGSKGG
jgi:hypothetical protein